jgi:hypothetical protein
MAMISGSTVGFPGGTRKPSRARHPIMITLRPPRQAAGVASECAISSGQMQVRTDQKDRI